MHDRQGQNLDAVDRERVTVNLVDGKRRHPRVKMCGETVGDAGPQIVGYIVFAIHGKMASHCVAEGTHVIDASDMVIMAVGEQHGIDVLCPRCEHLMVEVGAAVDEDDGVAGFKEGRRAHPLVAGVGRATHFAITAQLGYPGRGPCPEKSQFHFR